MIRRPPRSTLFPTRRSSDLLADDGWLERLHHALLMAVREHQGREVSPTLAIIDSRSVKVMAPAGDRKSTRLNSSHANISYAVFCLKKKNKLMSRLLPLSILL